MREERRLAVFEKTLLKRDEVTGEWNKLNNYPIA
jgi:hypothetical protein